jgi:hypothetical protein
MYHFLTTDMTKLNLENYTGLYLEQNLKEKHDYVLVNEKVWRSLKNYYGGGPEIPFFLVDDVKKQEQFGIEHTPNFLFHQPYIYGCPDTNPKYLEVDFVVKNEGGEGIAEEQLRIKYTLLVSYAMTFEQFVYY